MNITLLCNRDLPSHIALSQLIDGLAEHNLSIFISEKVGADKTLPEPLMELAAFERQLLMDGRPRFEQLAESAGCSLQGFVDLDNRVNSPEGIARIVATEPELIISVRFGLIKNNSRKRQAVGTIENKGNVLFSGNGIQLLNLVIGEHIAGGVGGARNTECGALLIYIQP